MPCRLKRRLWHLVVGTRGGIKRAEIIHLLSRRPYNAHELARLLGVDYKTARHHLKVLVENGILVTSADSYGTLYFWSAQLQADAEAWREIWESVGRKPHERGDPSGEPA